MAPTLFLIPGALQLLGESQRHLYQVLTYKPGLQFIGAKDIAHQHVILS